MRVLRIFQSVHLQSILLHVGGGPDLAVRTSIPGTPPVDAALQLPIHDKLMSVDYQLTLFLPGATKSGQM